MNDEPDEGRRERWGPRMSRSTLLRRARSRIAGATAGTLLRSASEAASTGATVETALKFLNGWEFDYVTAMAETIWPTDDLGPGAKAAGVGNYIDGQLAGELGTGPPLLLERPFFSRRRRATAGRCR